MELTIVEAISKIKRRQLSQSQTEDERLNTIELLNAVSDYINRLESDNEELNKNINRLESDNKSFAKM